jgi:flagellar hook-associated protein 2
MGVVGLSFGSATSGQGFNVSNTVNQIISNLQAVEKPWQTQLSNLEAQDSEFSTLGVDLAKLITSLQNLTDFTGVLANKDGSSSDNNVLQLTGADSSAIAGSHTIVVKQLATTESYASGFVSSGDDTVSGSITIGSTTITIDGSESLSELATQINREGIGVTAQVVSGVSGSKLSIVSDTSGSSGAFTVSGNLSDASGSISLSQSQAPQNAVFTVDGVTLTSSSNTVTNAIQGVTFQLEAAPTPPETIQVQITNDTTSVASAIFSFVSNYNTIMEAIDEQEGTDSSGNAMPLFGNTALAQIQEQLESSMTFFSASGSIQGLSDLGITLNNNGTLSLNVDTLSSAINNNYSGIVSFFQDAGNFGSDLSSTLNNFDISNPNGLLTLTLGQLSSEESTVKSKISSEDAFISKQKATLTAELDQANTTLQEIPLQLNEINEIYSAFTGFNSNKG